MVQDGLKTLHGITVLIAEDEPMIAMLLEDTVERLGGRVAGVVGTPHHAIDLIESTTVSLVVLDVNLAGATSEAVLVAADARQIPVLVSSGADPASLPAAFRGRRMLPKPWTMEGADEEMAACIRQAGAAEGGPASATP